MTDQTTTPPRSKSVTATMYEDGNVEVVIGDGVTAFDLYGLAGMLTLQANVKMAGTIAAANRQTGTGIVVPQ